MVDSPTFQPELDKFAHIGPAAALAGDITAADLDLLVPGRGSPHDFDILPDFFERYYKKCPLSCTTNCRP